MTAAPEQNLKGAKVGVVGLGPRTGVSMIRYLSARGAKVVAYDRRPADQLASVLRELAGIHFELDAGQEVPTRLGSSNPIIVSPGVPFSLPFLVSAKESGTSVWSEIEFAAQHLKKPLLVVTGTNGKSTTTSLLAHLLSTWGKKVFAGGNLGRPLIEAVEGEFDFVVAEISSFQLEGVETFHPHVALLLNISPNHLDRHGDMTTYVAMKERAFARMTSEDHAIFNADDSGCLEMAGRTRAIVWTFSAQGHANANIRLEGSRVRFPTGATVSLAGLRLFGKHNIENAIAAAAAAVVVGCPTAAIEKGIETFRALPHRLELIAEHQGIRFINDSKSTTPASAVKAVQSFPNPVILLAGGRAKGTSFNTLGEASRDHVKLAILYGEAAHEMSRAFTNVPRRIETTMKDAFKSAVSEAKKGDVILLSPANASFDQFKDYEDRGRQFAVLVGEHVRGELR